ncbi:MAG: 7-cyano-7-deazaguanine synthase QueC [Pseudomonadales bacterium]|nr:7-cyano-7-deazaguanine synthase QueC [Pseudomonadales bacterium]
MSDSSSVTTGSASPARAAQKSAVVLLSGGLDSATVLAMAIAEGYQCDCLSFDYGQRHATELQFASDLAVALGARTHRVVSIDLGSFGGSALTDMDIAVPTDDPGGIPVTYVPARNTVFLSYALALAEVTGAMDIFIGVNAVDYSGYPDCRPEFISAFETMANLATRVGVEGHRLTVHSPLIDLTKAEIIRRGVSLGVDYSQTVSCYQLGTDGSACGECDSCRIRKQGFMDAKVQDPTLYR